MLFAFVEAPLLFSLLLVSSFPFLISSTLFPIAFLSAKQLGILFSLSLFFPSPLSFFQLPTVIASELPQSASETRTTFFYSLLPLPLFPSVSTSPVISTAQLSLIPFGTAQPVSAFKYLLPSQPPVSFSAPLKLLVIQLPSTSKIALTTSFLLCPFPNASFLQCGL